MLCGRYENAPRNSVLRGAYSCISRVFAARRPWFYTLICVLPQDDEVIIFPNRDTHHTIESGAIAPSTAMSYVHYLVVPKQRIFNAVTLNSSHLQLLASMRKKAEAALLTKTVKDFYLTGVSVR